MHTGSRSISFAPYLLWPRAMGVPTSPGRIIAEPSKETSLRTDRLSHFGHRMSLFLQTPVLRGILSRQQAHRQEVPDEEEFHMKKILTQYVVCTLAVALMVPL